MIELIKLHNFQGHANTELAPAPGVTVITGQSDAGKSSIIRALWWVARNRPGGAAEAFRRTGAAKKEGVSAAIVTDTAHVARYKRGQENGYLLAGDKLKAIKQDVPTEVAQALRLGDYSIQPQHQPYFLVADSPGDVARKLNEVCGLDIIDTCLRNAGLLASRNAQALGEAERHAEDLEEQLGRYHNLPELEKLVARLEKREAKRQAAHTRLQGLRTALGNARALRERKVGYDDFLGLESQVAPLLDSARKRSELADKRTRLQGVGQGIGQLQARLAAADSKAAYAEQVQDVLLLHGQRDECVQRLQAIRDITDKGRRRQADLERLEQSLRDKEQEFRDAMEEVGVCPLCEQEVA